MRTSSDHCGFSAQVEISVRVRRESGEQVEAQVAQPLEYVGLLEPADDPDHFPMLWHVDPYGDTIFNRLQTRSLLRELAALRVRQLTDTQRRLVDDLTFLCHLGRPHRFLWFIGD
jgi:hypothetical protein